MASDSEGWDGLTPTHRVVEVREVRAENEFEAVTIAELDLQTARNVDTGEAGHVADGWIVGVLNPEDPEPPSTVNQALLAAAVLLIEVTTFEGDDGTGGAFTRNQISKAIRWATDALSNLD